MDKEYIGYCIQCKGKKTLLEPSLGKHRNEKSKNDHVEMIKGKCPDCGGTVYSIQGHG